MFHSLEFQIIVLNKTFTQLAGAVEYNTKQSDGEIPVMLELWGMQSTPSLPLLPDPLWPGVVAPNKGPIYGLNRTKPWFEVTVFGI